MLDRGDVPMVPVTVTFSVNEEAPFSDTGGVTAVTSVPPLPATYVTSVALPAVPNVATVTPCRLLPEMVTGVPPVTGPQDGFTPSVFPGPTMVGRPR